MLKVAVAGASGYMGAELLRLLSVHPKIELCAVTSERLAGERLDHVYPHLRSLSDLAFQELDAARLADLADVVFLALPHMESQRAVPVLRGVPRLAPGTRLGAPFPAALRVDASARPVEVVLEPEGLLLNPKQPQPPRLTMRRDSSTRLVSTARG